MDSAFPISRAALGERVLGIVGSGLFLKGLSRRPPKSGNCLLNFTVSCHPGYGNRIQKPYLEDLLYFEWMEIEVHTMPDRANPRRIAWQSFHGQAGF